MREGTYSQNQVTRIYLVAFQLFYLLSHVLQNQHTILQLKYINSSQFLSQTISN